MNEVLRPPSSAWPEPLTTLAYELLDAHLDTVDLASDLMDERWRAHVGYLRALQRIGRELLADAGVSSGPASVEAPR
jgi:hypothetical protein